MDRPRFPDHHDCEGLTGITLEHLPSDGSLGRVRRYAKGEEVWQPDDGADRLYFLRRGRVAITTATPEHRPVLLRTVEVGQPFGELCLCAARTRCRGTTASALVASEAIEVKPSHFRAYVRRNPEALDALLYTFCMRLTDAEHRVEVLGHRGAEQRLGRLMLRLGKRGPRDGHRDTVTLSVSHSELAKMAGMSAPTSRSRWDGSDVSGSCAISAKALSASTCPRSPPISAASSPAGSTTPAMAERQP